MALMSDAVMVIFCDVTSGVEDHDDWHTSEHMHERLSIPGFLRGSRWIRAEGSPRWMIFYEVSGTEVANAREYLARLNKPSPWTSATMTRLTNMSRGFCRVTASAGYGLGHAALALRFDRLADSAREGLSRLVPRVAASRGVASAHLFEPEQVPPMTKEQSLRGRDAEMPSVLLATAYDAQALHGLRGGDLGADALARRGLAALDNGLYALGFTATAAEVLRTPALPRSGPKR